MDNIIALEDSVRYDPVILTLDDIVYNKKTFFYSDPDAIMDCILRVYAIIKNAYPEDFSKVIFEIDPYVLFDLFMSTHHFLTHNQYSVNDSDGVFGLNVATLASLMQYPADIKKREQYMQDLIDLLGPKRPADGQYYLLGPADPIIH